MGGRQHPPLRHQSPPAAPPPPQEKADGPRPMGGRGGKWGAPLHPAAWGDQKGGLYWGAEGVYGVSTPKLGSPLGG